MALGDMHNNSDQITNSSQPRDDRSKGEATWQTKDMRLIVTLLARGHKPIEGGVFVRDNVLWFSFNISDVAQDILCFNSYMEIEVNAHEFWRAWEIFRSYLRRYSIGGK